MKTAPSLFLVLPLATLVSAVVTGVLFGLEIALLVVAGGALVGVIALFWSSVQALTGESPLTLEEAMSLGAPSAEEEQKRAVLRALKDLEFERGVGKLTEEDYQELSTRYRAEARRLITLIDESTADERKEVERRLKRRVAEALRDAPEAEPSAPPTSETGKARGDDANAEDDARADDASKAEQSASEDDAGAKESA